GARVSDDGHSAPGQAGARYYDALFVFHHNAFVAVAGFDQNRGRALDCVDGCLDRPKLTGDEEYVRGSNHLADLDTLRLIIITCLSLGVSSGRRKPVQDRSKNGNLSWESELGI